MAIAMGGVGCFCYRLSSLSLEEKNGNMTGRLRSAEATRFSREGITVVERNRKMIGDAMGQLMAQTVDH